MTDTEFDPQTPANDPVANQEVEAPGASAAEPASAAAPESKGGLLRLAGLVVALCGAGLAVAPHVSPAAAHALAKLVAPEVYGGILLTAGLALFVGGLLRRSLGQIRGSLSELGAETARIESVSNDTRGLCETVADVQLANLELKSGVADLQKRMERLTEIASDPEHTVSMFRLAASVDQLGARLDIFIKDQFKAMRQQLDGVVERAQQTEQNLGGRIAKMLEEHHAFNAKASAGLERKLAEMRAVLGSSLEALELERQKAVAAQAEALEQLGQRVELRLQEQTSYVAECLGQLDGAVERSGRERDAQAKELAAQLEQRLAEHSSALQQSLVPVAAAQLRTEQAEASLLSMVADLEAHVAVQQQELRQSFEQGLERVRALAQENRASSAEALQAVARLETRVNHCQDTLSKAIGSSREEWKAGIGQLGGSLEARVHQCQDTLSKAIGSSREEWTRGNEEWKAGFVQLGGSLEARVHQCQDSLAKALGATREEWKRGSEEWKSALGQLGSSLERKLDKQGASVGEQLQQIDGALVQGEQSEVARHAQVASLGERVEHQLATHSERIERLAGKLGLELAGNSARLEQLGTELAAYANLTLEAQTQLLAQAQVQAPLEAQTTAQEFPTEAIPPLDRMDMPETPRSIIPPDCEPPSALPSSPESRSDVES